MRPVVWISDPSLRACSEKIASGTLTSESGSAGLSVNTLDEFLAAANAKNAIGFVDQSTLPALSSLNPAQLPRHIIAICNDSLANVIGWLQPHPWLSHVISGSMFEHPLINEHMKNVLGSLIDDKPRLLDWLGPEVEGRRVRLSHASKRAARLERMGEYLESNGVRTRTIDILRNAAEELLTNAFYDAPVAAGAIKGPISRTLDVALPEEFACDLAYGCREDLAIVRVKDPFGSLSRNRLVEVLTRCARSDMSVEVDESMGGAGLGMWRIFSNASFVAISVVKHSHTEILVGLAKRAPGQRPFAFHLFFGDDGRPRYWKLADAEDTPDPQLSNSVLLELMKSK